MEQRAAVVVGHDAAVEHSNGLVTVPAGALRPFAARARGGEERFINVGS